MTLEAGAVIGLDPTMVYGYALPPYVKLDWKTGTDNPEYGDGVTVGDGDDVCVGDAVGLGVGECEGVGDGAGVACVDTSDAMSPRFSDPKPEAVIGFASELDTWVPDVRMTGTRCLPSVCKVNPKWVIATMFPWTTTREGGLVHNATYAASRFTATT
jgi:hypothetical protein